MRKFPVHAPVRKGKSCTPIMDSLWVKLSYLFIFFNLTRNCLFLVQILINPQGNMHRGAMRLFCKPSVIVLNLYRSMAGLIEPTRNWNDYMIRLCSTFVLKNVKQLGSFMQIDGNCLLYFGIIKCYLFICSVQFVHEFHPCGRPTERGKKKRLTSLWRSRSFYYHLNGVNRC